MSYTLFDAGSLESDRCPHCRVSNPLLSAVHVFKTTPSSNTTSYKWRVYVCSRCGFPVIGGCGYNDTAIGIVFPQLETVDEDIPEKARAFLVQAIDCIHAPSGAIMLCASAVDALLKEKGLKAGKLYARIEQAAKDHLITDEMSLWAHEVRLDANDERHADDSVGLPTPEDAKKCVAFVRALADFLFVLPARIERGRKEGVA